MHKSTRAWKWALDKLRHVTDGVGMAKKETPSQALKRIRAQAAKRAKKYRAKRKKAKTQ